jgi:hypothetical protein
MKNVMGDVALGSPPDIWHNMDGKVVSSMDQPHSTPNEILLYSFLFVDE